MRLIVAFALALVCFAVIPAKATEIDFGRYHALVIGNNKYEHLKPLETAVSDAAAVAELLKTKYGFEVTLRLNVTRDQILSDVNALRAELTERDRLLIYYAGHGELDRQTGTGYWLPVDAKPEDDTRWIANESLTRHFRAMTVQHILVVVDSCYSGALVRAASAAPKTGAERDAWLERMAKKRARLAFVSGSLEPVLDGGAEGHSVFASAFLSALRENDDILNGQALAQRVSQQVVLNADQTPQYSDIRKAGHEGGDFLFVPKGLTTVAVPPVQGNQTDARTLDLALWNSVKGSTNPAAFEAYLAQFPEGVFSALAALKIEELTASAERAEQRTAMITPPAPEIEIEIEEVDWTFVALKNANLRLRPTTKSEKVATLQQGAEVAVTGKVKDAEWYRIDHAGLDAYVYAPLLQEKEAWEAARRQAEEEQKRAEEAARRQAAASAKQKREADRQAIASVTPPKAADEVDEKAVEVAFWRSVQQSSNAAGYRSYLESYPNGAFAPWARNRLRTLEPTVALVTPARPLSAIKPLAVGTEVEYQCTGSWSTWSRKVVWRVTSMTDGIVRAEGKVGQKSIWFEKPYHLLGTSIANRRDQDDGKGIRKQLFNINEFKELSKLIPGTKLEGNVKESHDMSSWEWSYTITVGEPKEVEVLSYGKVKVIPVHEFRWNYRNNFSSEFTTYLHPELRFPVFYRYNDKKKRKQVCTLSSLKQP